MFVGFRNDSQEQDSSHSCREALYRSKTRESSNASYQKKPKQTTKPQKFINRHKSASHGLLFYLALQVSSWTTKLSCFRNPWTRVIRRWGRTKPRRWRQTLQTPCRWRGGSFLWCGSRGGSSMASRKLSAGLPKTMRTNWLMGAIRTTWPLTLSTQGAALGQLTAFKTHHSNVLRQHVDSRSLLKPSLGNLWIFP